MMTYMVRRAIAQTAVGTARLLAGILVLTAGLALANSAALADAQAPSAVMISAPDPAAAPLVVTNYHCHILPVAPAPGQAAPTLVRPSCDVQGTGTSGPESTSCSTGGCGVMNYHGGPTITQTQHRFVFLNCSTQASCYSDWGNPLGFLSDFFTSNFVHVTDQYMKPSVLKTSGRYLTSGAGAQYGNCPTSCLSEPHVLSDSQLQALVMGAVNFFSPSGGGGGYNNMYSFYLPAGQDLCFNSPNQNQCYCPDANCNGGTFVFCAYHGSFDAVDVTGTTVHVIYQAMPYQNVSGCQTSGGPNGTLTDSTNSVFSHEITETITDPDLNAWWRTSDGSEIGDICYLQRQNPIYLHGNKYDIQPEYSNAATDCVGAYATLALSHDFNFDMNSDIAWRNSNGDLAFWLMDGTQTLSGPDIGNVPTSWSIVGQRQLNNSGYADLIWRNTNGDVAIWLMNGTQILSAPDIGNVPTNWTIVGTGAYDATKGYAELFWRDTAGDVAIWQMNGTQLLSGPGLGNVPTNWTIVGTGDFGGTGNTDILWRDTAGDVAIWFMNGTQLVSTPGLGNVPTSWAIVGTGDFNGDGKTDILWRDANGDVAIWLMNGTQILSAPDIGNVPTNWTIAQTGDFNGDGNSDIQWRDTAGDVAIWFMNGTQLVSGPGLGNVPTSWTIQGANAD